MNSTSVSSVSGRFADSTAYSYDDYYDDPPSQRPCDYDLSGAHILPVLYSLFFAVGVVGNALAVWVLWKGLRLRSMTDVCLLNLALADLLLLSSLPFLAHYATDQWVFGSGMCTVVLSCHLVGFYGGIFFVVLMSLDRYLAVVHAVFALRARTKSVGALASLLIWGVAVSSSFPDLLYLATAEHENKTLCTFYAAASRSWKLNGIFKMNVLGLVVPLCSMGFCYSMILHKLRRARSSRKQAMRLVVTVVVVYFCCWAPYNISAFVRALELKEQIATNCQSSGWIRLSLQITEALAYSHSCINPVLYVFVGEKFRRQLWKLLLRTPCSKLPFMKSWLTQGPGSVYSQTTSVEDRASAVM